MHQNLKDVFLSVCFKMEKKSRLIFLYAFFFASQFPPYATNEIGKVTGLNRRELGHGKSRLEKSHAESSNILSGFYLWINLFWFFVFLFFKQVHWQNEL